MSIRYYTKNSGSITQGEFDPKKDYENEYAKVHFRIETPLYDIRNDKNYLGFPTNEDNRFFYEEIMRVLADSGWAETTNDIKRGKESLFIHPHDVSGIVKKNNIGEVAEVIDNSCCSSIRWVDVYQTFWDISDDECLKILQSKEQDIIKDLLITAKTKRRNQYYDRYKMVCRKAGQHSVKRVGIDLSCGVSYGCEISRQYIEDLLLRLVRQGYMVVANNNKLIRCRNKTELRAIKLPVDYDVFVKAHQDEDLDI